MTAKNKTPKYHVEEEFDINFWEFDLQDITEFISFLQRSVDELKEKGYIQIIIKQNTWAEGIDLSIIGWRPMTPEEKRKAKEANAKEAAKKAAIRQQIIDEEINKLRKLAEKYPNIVKVVEE